MIYNVRFLSLRLISCTYLEGTVYTYQIISVLGVSNKYMILFSFLKVNKEFENLVKLTLLHDSRNEDD